MTDSTDDAGSDRIAVIVARTGGFAGIGRRWRVDAEGGDAEFWTGLVESCPWDAAPAAPTGADRFVWEIEVVRKGGRRRAELPEPAVSGPWRALVDAVRSTPRPSGPSGGRDGSATEQA